MASRVTNDQEGAVTLETATLWARSNREWDKVYRYILIHPQDFFAIIPGRKWSIAHQTVYHGDVDLLKRILALFSDNQIDIHTKSGDNKTLLDVAKERRDVNPLMYTYIEHLSALDELFQEAKNKQWRTVLNILQKNKQIANEKPPYSPYFLVHYAVEHGDEQLLQELLDSFQCHTNVLNDKRETPLDMALRLNRYPMCSILQPKTDTQTRIPGIQPSSRSSPEPSCRTDERSTFHAPTKSFDNPARYQSPTSLQPQTAAPLIPLSGPPRIGFDNIIIDITQNGNFTISPQGLFNSSGGPSSPSPSPQRKEEQQQQQQSRGKIQHVDTKKTIVKEHQLTNLDPPPPPPPRPQSPRGVSNSSNQRIMKNLICPLTNELFVEPVIAGDGQTYERSAILDWINVHHQSPTTGAPLSPTFRENTEIKKLIQSIQKQN